MTLTKDQLSTIRASELEAIWADHGAGLTPSLLAQTMVKAKDLYVAPEVFQPRSTWERTWVAEEHIRSLAATAKLQKHRLEHIVVIPVAGIRIVVDGHCRLAAYKLNDPEGSRAVPVTHFRGTFREALFLAVEGNSKDKLPLTTREKAEAAWKLVVSEEERTDAKSLREIGAAASVSKSLVGNMRKVLERNPKGETFDPREGSWLSAANAAKGARKFDHEAQELRDVRDIADIARRTRKALGPKWDRQPDLLRRGIEQAYPVLKRRQKQLAELIEGPSDDF